MLCFVINGANEVYGELSPKRLWSQSVTRYWANGTHDAGLWLNAPDSLGMDPLKNIGIEELDKAEYHAFGPYEQPWFLPIDEMLRKSVFLPVDFDKARSVIPHTHRTTVSMINQTKVGGEVLTFFHLTGPSHFGIRVDSSLVVDWSFDTPVLHSSEKNDNSIYIFIANGFHKWAKLATGQRGRVGIDERNPVRSEMVFWLKTKPEMTSFTVSGHHVNGLYALPSATYQALPWLKRKVMGKLPAWVDVVWIVSEMHQINLVT